MRDNPIAPVVLRRPRVRSEQKFCRSAQYIELPQCALTGRCRQAQKTSTSAQHPPIRRSRFGVFRGAKHRAAGIAEGLSPWRQAKRAAPQARRREGLTPNSSNGEGGAVQSVNAPQRNGAAPSCRAAKAALRPAARRGAGGRQAAWGLLRDQISVCVPSSSSISRA